MRKIFSLLLVVFVCAGLWDGQAWAKRKLSAPEEAEKHMTDDDRMLVKENEARYRRYGMTAESAHWGAWSRYAYPSSTCAISIGMMEMEKGSVRDASVGAIESGGMCTEKEIIRSDRAYLENFYHPKKRIYDPSKDIDRITRLYFRDHYNEAIKMLMDVGTTEAAARRTADIVIHDGPYSACRREISIIYQEQKMGMHGFYADSYDIAKELNGEHYCNRYESDLGSRH